MPLTGTALLIAVAATLAVWGGKAAVHGVKHVAHKVLHHAALATTKPPQAAK
jgi:hypothetical protein